MANVYLNPSFYAHILSGFLILISTIIVLIHFKNLIQLDPYKIIVLLLFFSLVVGIHGISHLGLESVYNYNPLKEWTPSSLKKIIEQL